MNTTLPDYAGGSIVNLMSTLQVALGAPPGLYPPLRNAPADLFEGVRRLVLVVIDGLGYHTLRQRAGGSTLERLLLGSLTSVFPSTTATAIPVFLTGLAPQQHGLTGWHIWFEELDQCLAVLPLERRGGGPLPEGFDPARLFGVAPIFGRLPAQSTVVAPAHIVGSRFNRLHTEGAVRIGYRDLRQMFDALLARAREPAERHFLYGYYPGLDACAHQYGIAARRVDKLLAQIDAEFARFLAALAGSDTRVVLTADHGFIDARRAGYVELSRHPRLAGLLARPLCGERRLAYCYVRPGCGPAFEEYVAEHLGEVTRAWPSEELVERGWFGLGRPSEALRRRIGHYTLVMAEGCTIKDWLPGEQRHRLVGVHGGVSAEEMTVPLVATRT